jgi:hypothetical protein
MSYISILRYKSYVQNKKTAVLCLETLLLYSAVTVNVLQLLNDANYNKPANFALLYFVVRHS